ncbi:acyltransferase [Streptomyces rugosispiralis]|uniref:Acyltransferase n=1 Tax=Streptomyces rugosispiralis TaxID=2967341 RepID=A0ABT1V8Y9_9ACTN|nr:acyltransferase [Streptomyces rugosispiralis]MCQ8193438.1 acyltransferase [Streptomyces rugosispiralis]
MASPTATESSTKRTFTVRAEAATGDRIRLSVYDMLIGLVYTPRTFFYRETLDGEALRASLSRTLRHFPMVSGRMKRDPDGRLSVLCDDSGVRFIETSASVPMPDHGPHHTAKKGINRYLSHVNPLQLVDHDTPLFTVKLTHMKGGGSVLGFTMNHAVADGSAYMRFLESWSREHRGLGYTGPGHDRGVIDALAEPVARDARPDSPHFTVTRRGMKSVFVGRILLGSIAKTTTMVITRFTAAELATMKDAAMADLAGTGQWISTNDALTGHLWKVLGALRARPDTSEERLGLLADFRAFAGGAVPEDYWGNTVTNTRPAMSAAELRSRPLGEVAMAVRSGYAANTEQKIRQETAFLRAEYEAGRLKRILPTMTLDKFENTIVINNWSKLPFYSLDFGQGTPFWYDVPALPTPWTVLIAPTPADAAGGRDVHMAVPRALVRTLQEKPWTDRFHQYADSGEISPLTFGAARAER